MKRIIALAAILMTLSSVAGRAQDKLPAAPPQHGARHRLLDKLYLTDQQKQEIGKLRATFEKKMIDQRAKVQALRVDLKQAIQSEAPDQSGIKKILGSISSIQEEQKLALVDHLFDVRKVLTPEQQKTFREEFMKIGMDGRGPGRGFMRGRGQGGMRGHHPEMGFDPEDGPNGDMGELMQPEVEE
jgi:Spy/CpxP family protein refolding chaperone